MICLVFALLCVVVTSSAAGMIWMDWAAGVAGAQGLAIHLALVGIAVAAAIEAGWELTL